MRLVIILWATSVLPLLTSAAGPELECYVCETVYDGYSIPGSGRSFDKCSNEISQSKTEVCGEGNAATTDWYCTTSFHWGTGVIFRQCEDAATLKKNYMKFDPHKPRCVTMENPNATACYCDTKKCNMITELPKSSTTGGNSNNSTSNSNVVGMSLTILVSGVLVLSLIN